MAGLITINAAQGPRSSSPVDATPYLVGINRNHVEGDTRWQSRKTNLITTMRNLRTTWGSAAHGRNSFVYRIGHGPTDGRTDYNYMRGYHFKDWWGKHGYAQVDPRTGLTTYDYDDIKYPLDEAVAMGAFPQMVVNTGTGDNAQEAGDLANYCNKLSSPLRSTYNSARSNNPYNIRNWELGNEIAWQNVRGHSTRAMNPTQYAQYARDYAKAIRDNSDIPVKVGFVTGTGSDFRGDDGWYTESVGFESFGIIRDLLQGSVLNGTQQLDALIVHNYASWPQISDPKNGPEADKLAAFTWQELKLNGTGSSNSGVWNAINQYSQHEIELWNTEYFDHYYSVKSQSMFAAIYGLSGFVHAVNQEFMVNNAFCFFHGGNNLDEVFFVAGDYTKKTAWFRALEVVAQNWGDKHVRTTPSGIPTYQSFPAGGRTIMGRTYIDAPKVRAAASYSGDGTKLYVMLVNQTASENVDIEIALQNFNYNGNNIVDVRRVYGSVGWTSTWDQTLIESTGWTPASSPHGANVYRVPAASVVILTFTGEVVGGGGGTFVVSKSVAINYKLSLPQGFIQAQATLDLSNPDVKKLETSDLIIEMSKYSDTSRIFNKLVGQAQIDWIPRDRQAFGAIIGNTNTAGSLVDGNAVFMGTFTISEVSNAANPVMKHMQFVNTNWNGAQYEYKMWLVAWDRDVTPLFHYMWKSKDGTAREAYLKWQVRSLDNYQTSNGLTLYSTGQRALLAAGSGQDYIDQASAARGGISLLPAEWRSDLHNRNFEGTNALSTVAEYAYINQPHSSNVTKVYGSALAFSTFNQTLSEVRTEANIRWTNWNHPPQTTNNRLVIAKGSATADSNPLIDDEIDISGGFDRIYNAFALNADVNNAVQVTIKPFNSTTPYRQPKFVISNYSANFEPTIRRGSTKLAKGFDYLLFLDDAANKLYVHMFNDSVVSTSGTTYTIEALLEVTRSVSLRYLVLTSLTKYVPVTYKVKATVTKALAVQYKALISVAKTVAINYKIVNTANKTVSIIYKVYKAVTKSTAVVYKIRASVAKATGVSYKLLTVVGLSLTHKAKVEQETTSDYANIYKVLTTVTKTAAVIYVVRQSNRKSLDVAYGVLVEVTKALRVEYNVTGPQTSTHPITYDIFEEITETAAISYKVLGTINTSLTSLADIPSKDVPGDVAPQTQAAPIEYKVLEEVTEDPLPITYKVLVEVTESVDVVYAVTRVDVDKTFAIIYNMRSPGEVEPYRTVAVFYNVTEEVADEDLGAELTADIGIRYTISQEVTQTRALNWWIIREITKRLGINYSVSIGGYVKFGIRYGLLDTVANSVAIYTNTRQSIQIDNPIIYHVLSNVRLTTRLSYGLLKTIYNFIKVRYGTIDDVTSVTPIQYKLLFSVVRTRAIRYGVIGQVWNFLTSVAHMNEEVGARVAVDYAVLKTVSQSVDIGYSVWVEASKYILVYYGVIGRVGKDFTVLSYSNGKIIKDLRTIRDFGGPVTSSMALPYKIVQQVHRQAGITYKLSSKVSRTLGITYQFLTTARGHVNIKYSFQKAVASSVAVNYQYLTSLSKSLDIRYATEIRIEVTKSAAVSYGLKTTVAPKTLQIRFALTTNLVKTATVSFNMLTTVSMSETVNYRVMTYAYGETKVVYKLLSTMLKTLGVGYGTKKSVTKGVNITHEIFGNVVKSVDVLYEVLGWSTDTLSIGYGIKNVITKDLAIRYNLAGAVTKTVAVPYFIVHSVGITLVPLAHITGRVVKTLPLTHNVLESVGKPLAVGYKVLGRVTKMLGVRYNTQVAVVSTLAIKYELDHAENLMLPPQPTDVWLDVSMDLAPPQPRGVYIDMGMPGE